MQLAFFCCFRQGVAGMSWDLGRDVPDLEKQKNSMQENFGLIFRTLNRLGIYLEIMFARMVTFFQGKTKGQQLKGKIVS